MARLVEKVVPRVNDRRGDKITGKRKRFASKNLDQRCRKSPKSSEVVPLLYLYGLSARASSGVGAAPRPDGRAVSGQR